jgi:hypothetical protein
MKAMGFSTRVYVFVQNELVRNVLYHILVMMIEYISIFLSLIDTNFKLGVLQQDVINQIDFFKYINPLFYYKKLLTCSSSRICMLSDYYYYTIFSVIVGLILMICIYKYFANFQKVFKSFYKGINLIIINLLDLFFRIGGIFIYYLLLNKFMGGFYEFTNCTENNCYVSFISVITSFVLFIFYFFLNIKYFLLCKVYLNIEKKEFPYENLFSTKFNFYLIFLKCLISLEENFDNYKTLNYLTNFIRLTKVCSLIFFVIYIISKATSKSRIYVIGCKLNTFRIFLLIFNLIFLILTLVINEGVFFYCYNLLISFCAALPLSIHINRLNSRSIFSDETLISQFIYFLNILKNEEGNIELMDDSYCRFLKYHLECCTDELCHLCKNYLIDPDNNEDNLNSSSPYINKYNLMKNIQNSSSNFSSSGKFFSEVIKMNQNQQNNNIIFSMNQGVSGSASALTQTQNNINFYANQKRNNYVENLNQNKNKENLNSNLKFIDSNTLNFKENKEKTTHSSRGLELIKNITEQIKFRMANETSANEYTQFDKIYFKILRISLKNIFRLNIFTSIFRFKRLLRRKDLGNLYHNLYYYMQSFCLNEMESSKQFTTIKKYEETLNQFISSVQDLEDLFIKVASGVVFGVDLYKLAEDLKKGRIKSNENLNYLSGVIFTNELNENLITLLNIIFRFIYNEFPNNHLATYFKDYLALERKLNEFYFGENYLIGKYNTTDDSISLIQLCCSDLNIVLKQNERNFDKLFHPLIRKQSKDILTRKIKELDTQNLRRIDLLVRWEKDSLQMIALKAKVIPSLDFEESIILGNFQFLKHDFVLVEKASNLFTSEIHNYIALLSKSMSDYLHLPCHILKKLNDKKIRFLFDEIFEVEATNSGGTEKSEHFIIRYDRLFLLYKRILSSSDSNEIFQERDLDKIKEKVDSKVKIKFILKKKEPIKGNKEKDREFLLYTFTLKKFSDSDKNKEQDGGIINGLNNQAAPNLTNEGENEELQSLFMTSSGARDSVHKSIESVSASSDFDLYNVRKDTKVNINNHNKNYNQKIKLITLIVTIFNFFTILIIIVFVYITTTKNTDVVNLVYTKGDLSVFQYNFYYAVMYSFIYYYLNPENKIYNLSLPQLNHKYSEYDLRKEKLYKKYGDKVNIDGLYTYMNSEFSYLIDLAKTKNVDVKNKIYTLLGSDNTNNIYYLITSGDNLQPAYFKFFNLLNIILENARIIGESSINYEQSNSEEKLLYLKIFNKNRDQNKIIFSNSKDSGEGDNKNLHKLAYESLINYYEVYKTFEDLEKLLSLKYDDSLTYLLEMTNVFSITVMILHAILLMICYSTIKFFIYSINSINKNIAKNLTKTKTEVLLSKIKNVKNLIYISKDPGEIINSISSTLKKWVDPKIKKSHKKPQNELFKLSTVEGEVESLIKFNKNKLIKPYLCSMLFILIIFIIFTGAFLILTISKTSSLRKISNNYSVSADLSHTIVNNIIFTKILILSNSTDEDISKDIYGDNQNFNLINDNNISDTGFINSNFNKVTKLLFEHLRILDDPNFHSIKEEFYNLDCAYIYNTYLEEYDSKLKSSMPELSNLPQTLCETLQFTKNTRNLFFNIIEEINFSNKRLFNSVVNSDRSYTSLKKVFDAEAMWDLIAYVIFVVRPLQNFLKEKVIFGEYVTAATILHEIVVFFLVFYIFLEILIFYLINSKFSQTILETNEKFSEFLNCIQ